MLRAVILDLDGLLIDSEPFWKKAEIEVFASVGLELTEALCGQTTGLRMDAAVQYWFQRHPWTGKDCAQVEAEVKDRVAQLVTQFAQPLPGVHELVALCKSLDLPLAVCSSSPLSVIQPAVEKLQISQHMTLCHSAEDEEFGKPHPAAYLTTARKLGIAPQACLAFEDSLNGMLSAKSARMKVVAVPDPAFASSTRFDFCDLKLKSLADFSREHFLALSNT